MSNVATKEDLENLQINLSKDISEVLNVLQTFMFQVDERFNQLEARMDAFDEKLDKLTNTIDGFVKRLDEHEIENAARDSQFEKLLVWAKKVSEKTGIPLENL